MTTVASKARVAAAVAILDRGRLMVEGAVAELVGRSDRQALVVDALPEAELEELRAWLRARGRTLEAVEVPRSRLDRVFLSHVGRDAGRPGSGAGGSAPAGEGGAR